MVVGAGGLVFLVAGGGSVPSRQGFDGVAGRQHGGIRINFRGELHVRMTHKFHANPGIDTGAGKVGGKGVPKGVKIGLAPLIILVCDVRVDQIFLEPIDGRHGAEHGIVINGTVGGSECSQLLDGIITQ